MPLRRDGATSAADGQLKRAYRRPQDRRSLRRSSFACLISCRHKFRIAFSSKRLDGEACDPECKAATEAAATPCGKLGHHVEKGMPQVSGDDIGAANAGPIFTSNLTMLVDFIAKATGKRPAREEFESFTWNTYQFGKTFSGAQYHLCWANMHRLSRQVAAWQQPFDAWITPVLTTPPLKIGTVNYEEINLLKDWARIVRYIVFTVNRRGVWTPIGSLSH